MNVAFALAWHHIIPSSSAAGEEIKDDEWGQE